MPDDILKRLDSYNCYCEDPESRQMRKDAAETIRKQAAELEALRLALKLKATHDHA